MAEKTKELLDKNTAEQVFLKKLADYEQACIETHKPYCHKCAIMEFKHEVERLRLEKEAETGSTVDDDDQKLHEAITKINFDKYSSPDYFNLIAERTSKNRRLVGTNQYVDEVNIVRVYECKPRKHSRTIEAPKGEMTTSKS